MKSTFPEATDEDIALAASLAMGLNQVMGALFQIPNEHITFSADPLQKSRSEDSIIAFTWVHLPTLASTVGIFLSLFIGSLLEKYLRS